MYKNIGGKIKGLVMLITVLLIIVCLVIGIGLIILGADDSDGELFIIIGIVVLIVGPIFAWISSFFAYGYGELIENSAIIAVNTSHDIAVPDNIQQTTTSNKEKKLKELFEWRSKNLITQEEYEKKVQEVNNE